MQLDRAFINVYQGRKQNAFHPYCFIGNKIAAGDIYASRNTTDFDMVVGGVYTFGEDGLLTVS